MPKKNKKVVSFRKGQRKKTARLCNLSFLKITAAVIVVASISFLFSNIFKQINSGPSSEVVEIPDSDIQISLKETDSLESLIESRPQHLALVRCSPPAGNVNAKKNAWPVCGIIGDVPQRERRTRLNLFDWNDSVLSVEFTDTQGISHDSQKWELVALNLGINTPSIANNKVIEAVSTWQNANQWVRNFEVQELSADSLVLSRLYKAVEAKTDEFQDLSWNSSKAYIDRRVLQVQHGVSLFENNGEVVEIAFFETGQSPYTAAHFAIPQSLEEYNATEGPFLYPEKQCEGATRQALLVHEPHQDPEGELAFFFLLSYLQEQYPSTFGDLHIFQEGQPSHLSSADPIFDLPVNDPNDTIAEMVQDSQDDWQSSFYSPLNGDLKIIEEAVKNFLIDKDLSIEGIWDESVDFYSFIEKSGALDTRAAMEANFRSRDDQYEIRQAYIDRLETLEVSDAAFAKTLVEKNGLRGSLAYELYVEGSGLSPSTKSVSVHGLDDAGIYYASCALSDGCMGPLNVGLSNFPRSSWLKIQPFRDWVMARTVVRGFDSLEQGVVPVVAASLSTHLPLVREFLCDAGINTITLSPSNSLVEIISVASEFLEATDATPNSMKPWHPPESWRGTTPMMSYLTSTLSPTPPPGIRPTQPSGEGIGQLLNTWLTGPGLF